MPLHHHLPATFLSSFSHDTSTPERRKRLLWAGERKGSGTGRTFRAPAARLGVEKDLYKIVAAGHDPKMVDGTWTGHEGGLADAVEKLLTGTVDARTWARVLVPFVACLVVRGPDFAGRFGRRLATLGIDDVDGGYTPADNANLARLMELQRLLGPVAVAKWIVFRFDSPALITNDLGYARFRDHIGSYGMAVPLGPSHALVVMPRSKGRVATVQSNKWVPDVEYARGMAGDSKRLNRAMSATSQRFVFGGTKRVVESCARAAPPASAPPEPSDLGFIAGRLAVAHEFTWHRLVPAVERDPSDGGPWDFLLDWKALSRGWAPRPMLPANLPEFPPALRREGLSIIAEFYDPTDHFSAAGIR